MNQPLTFYDDFYPRGFRKFFAMGIIFLTSALPATYAWQHGPIQQPQNRHAFPPRPPNRWVNQDGDGNLTGMPRSFSYKRMLLAMFCSMLGLMIYYPRWGFKRYALFCGPFIGWGTSVATSTWLIGRAEVYRVELVFAAMLGGIPGTIVYVLLARRKWCRKYKRTASEPVFESD